MTVQRTAKRPVWSIVLAGGEGERVKPFVLRWLGRHQPKQYCTFVGKRSMFQHTVERATTLTSPERTMVVAACHHHSEVVSQLRGRPIGKLFLQPANCDTAAGIFLPLAYLRARDPQAIVVILPSDHFIHPEYPFLETVRQAMVSAEAMPARMLLLGVRPDGVETDYGWIQRGLPLDGSPEVVVNETGSWAWLRMLRAGHFAKTALPDAYNLRLGANNYYVDLELRASSVENPYTLEMFKGFTCPPNI